MDNIDGNEILKKLELCGRVCYKSEHHIGTNTANDFIDKKIVQGGRGHLSVIEHCNITVRIITDRGVSHELVRHRLASYSQESTRYCNYSKKAFNNEITLIKPTWFDKDVSVYNNYDINLNKNLSAQELIWLNTMIDVECAYFDLLSSGITPQNARSVLPNSLKTEIIITANLRE
jgi:thymidylate synthase (FAD)